MKKWLYTVYNSRSVASLLGACLISKRSTAGLTWEIAFKIGCLTKPKKPNMLNYLPIAGGRRDRFMPFPRTLVQSEMQIALCGFELGSPIPFIMTVTINTKHISSM